MGETILMEKKIRRRTSLIRPISLSKFNEKEEKQRSETQYHKQPAPNINEREYKHANNNAKKIRKPRNEFNRARYAIKTKKVGKRIEAHSTHSLQQITKPPNGKESSHNNNK